MLDVHESAAFLVDLEHEAVRLTKLHGFFFGVHTKNFPQLVRCPKLDRDLVPVQTDPITTPYYIKHNVADPIKRYSGRTCHEI